MFCVVSIFLVHKRIMLESDRRSSELCDTLQRTPNDPAWMSIQVMNEETAKIMCHVLTYIYWGHVSVTTEELVPLWSIVDKLNVLGYFQQELKKNMIANLSFETCILYFLQAFSLNRSELYDDFRDVIYSSFIRDIVDTDPSNNISPSDWISVPPVPQFAYLLKCSNSLNNVDDNNSNNNGNNYGNNNGNGSGAGTSGGTSTSSGTRSGTNTGQVDYPKYLQSKLFLCYIKSIVPTDAPRARFV